MDKISKYKLYLIINLSLFLIISLFFYEYHDDYYYGSGLNYIVDDSKYYFNVSKEIYANLNIIIHGNIFGPIIFFEGISNGSRMVYFIINILFLFYAFINIWKIFKPQVYRNLMLFLIIVNPVMAISLSGPNKEITAFIAVLFIINYILDRKYIYIIFALLFAFLARLELVLIIFGFLFFVKFNNNSKLILFLILIVAISMVIANTFGYVDKLYTSFSGREGSLGFVKFLAELSLSGFYAIAFIPKVFINFYGELLSSNLFNLKGYSLIIYFSEVAFFCLSVLILLNHKVIYYRNYMFLFLLIYFLMYAIPPFIQHRYFLPIYPILIIIALYRDVGSSNAVSK